MSGDSPIGRGCGRRRTLVGVWLLVVLVAGGCAQVFGIDSPSEVAAPTADGAAEASDAVSRDDTAVVVDATSDAPSESSPEASAEASTDASPEAKADTGVPVEAGSDGSTTDAHDAGGDAGADAAEAGRYCDTVGTVAYCEDFDLTTSLGVVFTSVGSPFDGGAIGIDGTDPLSPPHSFHMSVTGAPVQGVVGAFRDLGVVPPTGATLDYDAKMAPAAVQGPALAGLAFSAGAGEEAIGVLVDSTDIGLFDFYPAPDGGTPAYTTKTIPFTWAPTTWNHFTLDISGSGPGYQAVLSVNGTQIVAFPLRTGFAFAEMSFNPQLNINGQSGSCATNIDNVVVHVR